LARSSLALAFARIGRTNEAQRRALEALALDSETGLYTVRALVAAFKESGDPAAAVELAEKAAAAAPDISPGGRAELALTRALALDAAGRSIEAGGAAAAAAKSRLLASDDRALAADLLIKAGAFAEAEGLFREALDGDAASTAAARGFSAFLLTQSRPAEAMEVALSTALPPDAEVRAFVSMGAFALGQDARAEALLDQACALDVRAACAGARDAVDTARVPEPFIAACRRRQPRDARLAADDGVALYLAGRVDEAERALREALRLDPGFLEAALSLSTSLESRGKAAEGRTALEAALASASARRGQPTYIEALRRLGR
jgi:tetratricopeptide (TPR) repeat protein